MEPKYSILLCNQNIDEYNEKIKNWLHKGIKVIWFGTKEEVDFLSKEYGPFTSAFILLCYEIDILDKKIILDGKDEESFVQLVLQNKCPRFNSAQYLVEHCKDDKHIIVQASAGTGKTAVMMDRIMYLLHTKPDLHLFEIFMITFTNDATDQMNKRLQDALMIRYKLTGDKKYLRWVEEQSQMNISTIHSFAYYMLKEYGIGEGFTKNLSIRGFKFEKTELIKDVIDDKIDSTKNVKNQLGIPFYRANSIVNDFWEGFSKLGISHKDIEKMDWGKANDDDSEPFQRVMTSILKRLDDEYFDIKRKNEAVAIDDVMRDLQEVLQEPILPNPDLSMKYLFIDEFQDSDLSQIMVACLMIKILNPYLFVVGDVKQSIYRFRGATDQAFFVLKQDMNDMYFDKPVEFTLANNYRTSESVLKRMDTYFSEWGKMGQLQYDKPVIPYKKEPGKINMLGYGKPEELDDEIARIASEELESLSQQIDNGKVKPNEKARVVILTRTNKELNQLASVLRRHKIPTVIRRDGSFYASEAVRDFYILVASFLFSEEPKYIFNFLLTPYAGEIESMDINAMEQLHGDYENLVSYLDNFLNQTNWKKYHKDLRLRPVLAVFKELLDNEPIIDNYIKNSKARMRAEGWKEERINAASFANAMQYQANLEKLTELLQRNLGGEKVSIYDVYNFLKINVATNRSEGEAEVVTNEEQTRDLYKSLLCMTVHKAKGLEFETVIIPYTNRVFPTMERTEILIDPIRKKVGWNYKGESGKRNKNNKFPAMKNDLYYELKEQDKESISKEETRILYVAMTRAIHNLICLVPDNPKDNTWADLIDKVGVDYE